jgi:N-acetyl-anhydromuramoyl-L-alanine amidase
MATFGPQLTSDGLLPGARFIPSANCDERPATEPVRLVVVHAISLPPGQYGGDGVEQLFTNRLDPSSHPYYREIHALRVSAHFFIRRDGSVIQFVPTNRRAWHAGASCWRGRERCNDFSLGIELEGCDEAPFTDIQYIRLARLIRILRKAFVIEDVVGHADIAPGRKTDPGPRFDWQRLRGMLRKR